jgi:nucleotide-binding universal stress UspA family protein
MKKILIAVDGSDHARSAIETVARFAREGPSPEVVLVNVRGWPVLLGEVAVSGLEQIEQSEKRHQERLLADAEGQAMAAGLAVRSRVAAVGEPAAEIVRAAQDCGADQIVLGTRGMGALGSFFMGSVAQRVVHLSKVPVLLVK